MTRYVMIVSRAGCGKAASATPVMSRRHGVRLAPQPWSCYNSGHRRRRDTVTGSQARARPVCLPCPKGE
jgi:hypothetical protein